MKTLPNATVEALFSWMKRCVPTGKHRSCALIGLFALSASMGLHAQTMVTSGQFAVSPSGAATYTIPIQVPPGVAGMQPQVALTYNSQGGNGHVGMGWSFAAGVSAISRCPRSMAQDQMRRGVNYDIDDRFCLDGQRLILVSGTYGEPNSEYRTEMEGFSRITYKDGGFVVQSKAGLTSQYGMPNSAGANFSKVTLKGQPEKVRLWLINKMSDVIGNYMTFSYDDKYAAQTGDFWLNEIAYTGYGTLPPKNKITFIPSLESDVRPDAITTYHSGSEVKMTRRLVAVETQVDGVVVRKYQLTYAEIAANTADRSRLVSVTECDGAALCLPAVRFEWLLGKDNPKLQSFASGARWLDNFGTSNGWENTSKHPRHLIDLNGDGLLDVLGFGKFGAISAINLGDHFNSPQTAITDFGESYGWHDSGRYIRQLADVNGDGLPDIVAFGSMGVYIALNNGNGFDRSGDPWLQHFGTNVHAGNWSDTSTYPRSVVDINGDGLPDLVGFASDGFYVSLNRDGRSFMPVERKISDFGTKGGWENNSQHPRHLIDINGDGLPDVVGFGLRGVLVSLNVQGNFGAVVPWLENFGSQHGWADADRLIRQLVDMNGDGLPDVVGFGTDGVYVAINNGLDRFFQPIRWVGSETFGSDYNSGGYRSTNEFPRLLADMNNDGLPDVIGLGWHGVRVALNSGSGSFLPPVDWSSSDKWASFRYAWGDEAKTPRHLVDIDGDGMVDVVGFTQSGIVVAKNQCTDCNALVQSFVEGSGTRSNVKYSSGYDPQVYSADMASSYPRAYLDGAGALVASAERDNGVGGLSKTTYQYRNLSAEIGTGRGMSGFKSVTVKEEASGIETYTEYRQDWPYAGQPVLMETRLAGKGNGGVIKRTRFEHACKTGSGNDCPLVPLNCNAPELVETCKAISAARVMPYAKTVTEESWDLNGKQMPTITTTTLYEKGAKDELYWGDVSRVDVQTVHGASSSRKVVVNEYKKSMTATDKWIAGRLERASVTSSFADAMGGSPGGSGGTPGDALVAQALQVITEWLLVNDDDAPPTPSAAPTIKVTVTPPTLVKGIPFTVTWSSTNASTLTWTCAANSTGFKRSGSVDLQGNFNAIANGVSSADWVKNPSTCTWTAVGPKGKATFVHKLTTRNP